MGKARLTELGVAKLTPPASGRVELFDSALPAFGVRVTSSGVKSFFVMTRVRGTLKRVTLGTHPALKLADARALAREAMALARQGHDPTAVKRAARQPAERPVERMIEAYIVRAQKARQRRSWAEVERALTRELAPWRGRPIESITRVDVLELLDGIVDRGAPVMANRLLKHLKHFLSWCVERGLIAASPAAGVRPPTETRSRDRVLGEAELRAAWAACDAVGWPFGALVRLLILTGQRRNEVAGMRWRDLDLEQRVWTLPREQTKSDRAHVVPLSDLAMGIIGALPRLGELVFPATGRRSPASDSSAPAKGEPARPVSGFSPAKARLDAMMIELLRREAIERGQHPDVIELKPWRFHDLRRTAASGMARLGVPPHVIGHALNHAPAASLGQLGAVYVRHDYVHETRTALEAWALEVEKVVNALGAGDPEGAQPLVA
jgi:integrase